MRVFNREVVVGLVLLAVALYFASASLDYGLGTARRLGPGYFPLVVAVALAILSAVIVIIAARRPEATAAPPQWRGLAAIAAGIFLFAYIAPRFGLVPAVAVGSIATAFADRRTTAAGSVILSGGICAGVVAVFHFGLGLPIALFRGGW